MKSPRDLFLLLLIIGITSCAKQSSPGGGPRDFTPPVVTKSSPESGTVNFTGNSFEVTFDEYFVLNGIDQKLLVSPPLANKPEIKTRKKSLVVSFNETLRDSSTYTFYFQDAIQDLNENNPVENFQYVFSTGPTLDSLSITGKIYNAENLEPGEDIFVVLYQGGADSLPRTTIPNYVTRATADGKFRMDNLAGGTYSIYGLKDLNNNKKYDLIDEHFAFIDTLITLRPENNHIPSMPDTLLTAADSAKYQRIPGSEYSLYLFEAAAKKQYMKASSRDIGYKLLFAFSMPVDSAGFDISFPESPGTPFILEPSVKRDTFLIWLKDSLFYSQPRISPVVIYPATDSTGAISQITDTIDLRYNAPRQVRGEDQKRDRDFRMVTNASTRKGLIPGENIRFSFVTPVQGSDTSKLALYLVSDTILKKQTYTIQKDLLQSNRFTLNANFAVDSTYLLISDKGAFSDIYGNKNDSVGYRFKIRNPESFGSLGVILSGYTGQVVLQLMSNDEKVLESRAFMLTDTRTERFPYLEPGDYRLKLIYDLDGNGEWTTGNFDTKRDAEPVAYYPEKINIKILWTIEQEWTLSGTREKSDNLRVQIRSTTTRRSQPNTNTSNSSSGVVQPRTGTNSAAVKR
jgi:uncharacterized protein (DUF2141 family)